jgi:hypothetical protein
MRRRWYLAAAAVLVVLLEACAGSPQVSPAQALQAQRETAPAQTAPAQTAPTVQRDAVTIDWRGASLNGQIPEWVLWAAEGDPGNQIAALPRLNGKKTILASNSGPDLDLLQVWVNLEAQGVVAANIKSTVEVDAGRGLEGNKDTEGNRNAVRQFINAFAEAEISGLGRELDFWVKERSLSANQESYTYYVVFSIEEENFNYLIEQALGKVSTQTHEEQEMLDEIGDRMKRLRFGAIKEE